MVLIISIAELMLFAGLFLRFPVAALPLWLGTALFVTLLREGSLIDALLLCGGAAIGLYALALVLLALSIPGPFRVLIILLFALPAGLAGFYLVADLAGALGSRFQTIWASVGAMAYFMLAVTGLSGSAGRLVARRAPVERVWIVRELGKAR